MHAEPIIIHSLAALLLAVKFGLVGLGWAWCVRPAQVEPRLRRTLVDAALAVLCSLLVTLSAVVVLASFDCCTPALEWAAIALLSVPGWALALRRKGAFLREGFAHGVMGAAVLLVLFLSILSVPRRGEWIPGGWDPGLYMNQGLHVARTGGFTIPYRAYFELPAGEARDAVRNDQDNRRQVLPGIHVNEVKEREEFQFFRLMPAFVAAVERCGGLEAALKANHVAGVLAVVMIMGLGALAGSATLGILAGAFMVLQPVFLWHTHVPVSEMLQASLILGALLAWGAGSAGAGAPWLMAACLFMAMINRVSFVSFGSMLVICSALWGYDGRFSPRRLGFHVLLLLALLAGLGVDLFTAWETVAGVSDAHQGMILAVAAATAVVLGLELVLPRWRMVNACWEWLRPHLGLLMTAGAVLAVPALFVVPGWLHRYIPDSEPRNLRNVAEYTGWCLSLLAWAGFILCWRSPRSSRLLRLVLLYLALGTALLVFRKYIESLYPWAMRRFLDVFVPFAALAAAFAVANAVAWLKARTRLAGVVAGVVMVLVAIENAGPVRDAWSRTEYDGASAVLAEVAALVPADSVILCDNHLWATPLQFVFGREALVPHAGKKDNFAERVSGVAAMLRKESPRRVFVVTTTQTGWEALRHTVPVDAPPPAALKLPVAEAIQHARRPKGFRLRERNYVFRVWELAKP